DFQSFFFYNFLEGPLALLPFRRVLRQKDQAGAILSEFREPETEFLALLLQEEVGHLHQDARAVAGVGFATASASMVEVAQHLELEVVAYRSAPASLPHTTWRVLIARRSSVPLPRSSGWSPPAS